MSGETQTTATAVQAAASIVALVIATAAFVIPAIQQKHRDTAAATERRLQAKCLATALRFDLQEINVALSSATLRATAYAEGKVVPPPPGPMVPEFLAAKIEPPPMLAASTERVYILGTPAGPTILRLLAALRAYNDAIDLRVTRIYTDPATPAAEHWHMLQGFISDLSKVVRQALNELGPTADG